VIDLRIIRPISAIVVLFMAVQSATLTAMVWPTPHSAPASGEGFETWAQATVSGDPASALFGCVRNDGRRFHEGIDIAPYHRRDRRGEATDPVVAAFTGTVAYVNTTAGDSSYGRYVIMEHPQFSPAVYTLYAHLAAVDASIEKGRVIDAGTRLGTMGRSAGGYTIPRDRAHLHFEIGLQLTERFQEWYDRQRYGSRNQHGNYSGLNLVGFDPLECYNWLRAHPQQTVSDYFDAVLKHTNDAKSAANWIMGDLLRYLNENSLEISECRVTPQNLGAMLDLIAKDVISGKIAKTVFKEMLETGAEPEVIVNEKGLKQISNEGEIAEIVARVLADNPQSVEDFYNGKEKAIGFLVGQIMKETKGKANPQLVNKLIKEQLSK